MEGTGRRNSLWRLLSLLGLGVALAILIVGYLRYTAADKGRVDRGDEFRRAGSPITADAHISNFSSEEAPAGVDANGAAARESPPVEDRPVGEEEREDQKVLRLLRNLLAVESKRFYHDMVLQHLDEVLSVMEYLQREPAAGLALVQGLYNDAIDPRHRCLLVFIASAARECPQALEFFRHVMADRAQDASIRLACAYALGMANLPIATPPPHMRRHFATVLWSIGNMLAHTNPRDFYGFPQYEIPRWPFTDGPPEWQGGETRLSVLQILLDAFLPEPCPRTRYAILTNLWCLEDDRVLADFYMLAYESEGWAVPEWPGDNLPPVSPARLRIGQCIPEKARKSKAEPWIDSLKWLFDHVSPWGGEGGDYYNDILEAYNELGLLDMRVVEHALLPFMQPEVGKGQFPEFTNWAIVPLRKAATVLPLEQAAQLYYQVVAVAVKNHEQQFDNGSELIIECLIDAHTLPNEHKIYELVLSHPTDDGLRDEAASFIMERAEHFSDDVRKQLLDALKRAHQIETGNQTRKSIEEALEKLSPGILRTMPPPK